MCKWFLYQTALERGSFSWGRGGDRRRRAGGEEVCLWGSYVPASALCSEITSLVSVNLCLFVK